MTKIGGPALAAWGFLVAKVVAAAFVIDEGPRVALAFATGFLGDAGIVLALVVLALIGARKPGVGKALGVVGALFALWSVFNVYFMLAHGSPLAPAMLKYAGDADIGQAARGPLVATVVAAAVTVIGAWPFVALVKRVPRGATALAVLLLIAGGAGSLLDDGRLARLGLDRNALLTLLERTPPDPEHADKAPWDAPWPAPDDDKYTAPVEVSTTKRPRHVVLWLAESVGTRHVSLYGNSARTTTPRLESLREHTLRFDRYYANAPVSAKAIFAVICGMHPLPHPEFEVRANPRIACPSLPETFVSRGYDAALFHGGYFAFTDKLALLNERGFSVLMDGESVPDRERWFTNGWGIDDAALVEQGLQWLDARPDPSRPTLAVYVPLLPHYEYFAPPTAPKPFGDATLLDKYENLVHYTDSLFGRLVDAYRERGLLDDTLFIFAGDHGEAFHEHPRNQLHALFLYEENIHTPLVLYSPALFAREQVSSRIGTHVDLLATIADLLGHEIPAGTQGRSLVATPFEYRAAIAHTWYPEPLMAVVDGDWKHIYNARTKTDELYHLATDPHERRNLALSRRPLVEAYRARLLDFRERQSKLIREAPKKDEPYLDRAFAALAASTTEPCARRNNALVCADARVNIAIDRAFNMERRCLRVIPPSTGSIELRAQLSPPPRMIGLGLTDAARARKGADVSADVAVEGHDSFTLTVSDVFEKSSQVRAIPASDAKQAAISIQITTTGSQRAVCVLLAP